MWGFEGRRRRFEEELNGDLELEEEEQRQAGLGPEEARRAALRALGNPALIRDQTHSVWRLSWLEDLLRDLRIGLRTLLRSPGFTVIALVVIALCIGATTALFTVVRSVLLRPLPFRDPQGLVMLYEHFRDPSMNARSFNYSQVAPGDYLDWRARTHGFEDMAIWRHAAMFTLTGERGELPELIGGGGGSPNLFPLLGVQAVFGRTFVEGDDRPDGNVAVLGWSLFERRFRGDPSVVGRQIHLDAKPYTVVGVLPRSFSYPDRRTEIWVPYTNGMPPEILRHHDYHFSRVVARLRPDTSLSSALSQAGAVQYRLHLENQPAPVAEDVVARSLLEDLGADVRRPLTILLAAAACMLLIGSLNVANLMVARSAARQREIAIRSALGAQRMTLIRAWLMESLLLAIAGGAAGFLISLEATRWLVTRWQELPSAQPVRPDAQVLGFAALLTLGSALVAGLLPAIASTRRGAIAALEVSSRTGAGNRPRSALRRTLLTLEIATTVVLLIAAGLLLKSFWRLRTVDLGSRTDNILTLGYSLPQAKYSTPERVNAFNEGLIERVRSLPGVEAAGIGTAVPGGGYVDDEIFTIREHPPAVSATALPDALYRRADPGYFRTLGVPLLEGRFFTGQDRAGRPGTVIISKQLAERYFPGEDPLGKHLHVVPRGNADYRVVGIVGDTLYQAGEAPKPTMYFPVLAGQNEGFTLAVRTSSDPGSVSVPVQRQIASLDPQLPVANVLTMREIIGRSLVNASLSARLVLAFAALSLVLASVGLYGVLSFLATQRTQEIGVRMALGAPRDRVLGLMLADGLRPAAYGLLFGLLASAGAVNLIRSMLYGTRPLDPAIYLAVAGTLLLVSLLACLLPAWRASRTDPMRALRLE